MKGAITITRTTSNQRADTIRIYVRDGIREIFRLEMTPETFALALTGLAQQECEIDMRYVPVAEPTIVSQVIDPDDIGDDKNRDSPWE